MTRYAVYFAPQRATAWWQAGCHWLGRDPETTSSSTPPPIAGVSELLQRQLTQDARRYGFHATLKAPFELAEGFTEAHLLGMAQAFARSQSRLVIDDPQVRPLGDFLALQPAVAAADIAALAMRCVSYFDVLRAPISAQELARRRSAGLSPRQDVLLQRWGYPFTEAEFRFHMTLTDNLRQVDQDVVYALRKAAESCFSGALETRLQLDGIAVFREAAPGEAFALIARFPFSDQVVTPGLPLPGRLFFLVGPSGSGKDTLLRWVEDHLPEQADIVFARRTITRAALAGEPHEGVTDDAFWQAAAAGQFAMQWQANELCYGVRRGIEADLRAGRDVIINGSREFVPQLRQAYPDARVIWIDADQDQIRQRIEARRREAGAALLRRLDRVTQFAIDDSADVIRLDNRSTVDVAGAKLMEILSRP
ncbi:phosphonate metabolism protein PhnN/1,5-bisphosphokinase (PRPP-forming) [Actimicrobium sp. GrIS 1.19]|uniref:phosphonate metabolism protein/1,5-bisphosphokinase (PRPP-forming) PhnN n=1 Tax=Actimicrobium sp. GrIS 1.19 TaxID=3071708 RepID=UPI002DFD7541|nr:phosphonate metabolism protein PhnN/1,5-bisphosphokinase (PRPP-forming) [Actimicrobium sp. GrIS 1.19]